MARPRKNQDSQPAKTADAREIEKAQAKHGADDAAAAEAAKQASEGGDGESEQEAEHPILTSSKQPESITLTNGDVKSRAQIVTAAFKHSDHSVEKWNALSETKREAIIQEFVDGLDIRQPDQAAEPMKATKESKGRASEVEKLLKPYMDRGVGFEADGNSWTMSYRGRQISGNLDIPDAVIKRQAMSLTGSEA